MHVGLPVVHLKPPSWHFHVSEMYEQNHSHQHICLQKFKAQTTCSIRFIAAISAILITIANPKPWDAFQVSNGAIEIIFTTQQIN